MTRGETEVLNHENQTFSTFRNKRQKGHNKPKELKRSQPSVLSPQSFDLGSHNFEKICTELLREGHSVKFRAPGDSMYPTICDGDVITVRPIETAAITIGDIILYRHKAGVAAHRVIRMAKTNATDFQPSPPKSRPSVLSPQSCFILRGDAAVVFDDPVSADQILGKVTLVEREGRRIDPYSFKATICFNVRRMAARLKRSILFQT